MINLVPIQDCLQNSFESWNDDAVDLDLLYNFTTFNNQGELGLNLRYSQV